MIHHDRTARILLWLIAGGLTLWGALLATGAYLFNHDPRRALMVLGTVLGFLGLWAVLLATRRRRRGYTSRGEE
jgi:hypothetical protein